jgi:hypothetical protein
MEAIARKYFFLLGKGGISYSLSQIELDEDSNTVGDGSIHYHIKIHTKHNLIKCLNQKNNYSKSIRWY